MTRRLLVVPLLAALASAACDRSAPDAPGVVRSDSSGVRLITSSGPDRELAWRLDSVDVLRDSLGEAWVFTAVSPSQVLTDRAGRSYVLENEPAVRRFGRDGRYERSFGRKGGAPGEMEFAIALLQQADSVAAFDVERGVLVRWGPDLEPINDLALLGALSGVDRLAFRTGGVWVQKRSFAGESTLVALYGDTTATTPLLRVSQPRGTILRGCNNTIAISLPPFFSPELLWDAQGARLLATVGPRYELNLYEGPRLIASVRREYAGRKPTADDVGRLYPEGLRLRAGSLDCTFSKEQLNESVGTAAQMPPAFGLALLADGTMWVQRSTRNEPPVLDVFASDGSYAGTIRGYHLPVGRLPNDEVLFPRDDPESGGVVVVRVLVRR